MSACLRSSRRRSSVGIFKHLDVNIPTLGIPQLELASIYAPAPIGGEGRWVQSPAGAVGTR